MTERMIRRWRRLELAYAMLGAQRRQWRAQAFIEALEDLAELEAATR